MTEITGTTVTEKSHGVVLTPTAVVKAGGCSGFKYDMFFDERDSDGDAIVAFDGVEVVVDKKSAPYLEGASIDYEDTLHSSGFQINNPNAASTCACGDSFN